MMILLADSEACFLPGLLCPEPGAKALIFSFLFCFILFHFHLFFKPRLCSHPPCPLARFQGA